jgi:hypothetical protein
LAILNQAVKDLCSPVGLVRSDAQQFWSDARAVQFWSDMLTVDSAVLIEAMQQRVRDA